MEKEIHHKSHFNETLQGGNCVEEEESESGTDVDEDSDEDPSFDILEETRSGFSKLSLKKSKSGIAKVIDSSSEEQPDDLPELNEKDMKSFENVEKMIADGQLEKLKLEQCKVYLRKNGLRLTGNKGVLIERITEHLGVINGGGEQKYPVSSFVLNCKGDACTGDVVMFEQNVYEMYNIASRSATGPPCGTRTVAGRIVKESYGSAKQQHTFTIEVLWNKGVKPLPPLHPLLIKGRNLYRLKTMRQLWADEEKRRNILLEKHYRGSLARSNRETRIQQKEIRKMGKEQRVTRKESNTTQDKKGRVLQPDTSKNNGSFSLLAAQQTQKQLPAICTKQQSEQRKPDFPQKTVLTEVCRQNNNISQLQPDVFKSENYYILEQNVGFSHETYADITKQHYNNNNVIREVENHLNSRSSFGNDEQRHFLGKVHQSQDENANNMRDHFPGKVHYSYDEANHGRAPTTRQVCHYYAQGRCYFGGNCKYLHEDREKHLNDERVTAKNSYQNANESKFNSHPGSPTRGGFHSPLRRSPSRRNFNCPPWSPNRGGPLMQQQQQQLCRYNAQGRCYHGERCKYLHERR